ncbi:zinc finger Ran-binding domain-containing protein 2-like isoform X3 [Salvia splendens]|uniref:zinc finger Ran-binding domain-containing protein 2-like isoform X3 n=1 Tax=Salvia splendens TaxID=180675 RepID=UPI001C27EA15|nr:zinc finger Ran-binding domain-containing protein 2-like isoform X3 [Salvia splendens]
MNRQGDWMCGACQHLNFSKRDSCQRCGCPKYAGAAEAAAYATALHKSEVLAGDWYCAAMNCGAHNYASRTSCYRCCASKDYCGYSTGIMAPGWKTGDWICSRRCNVNM